MTLTKTLNVDKLRPLIEISLYVVAICCFVLLFVGGPGERAARSIKELWNLGHTPAFALWTWIFLTKYKRLATWPPGGQFLALLIFIILGAACTEGAQGLLTSDRTASFGDAFNDAAGGFLAFSLWHWQQRNRKPMLIAVALLCGTLILAIGLIPLGKALADEVHARQMFPVLADFESPLELDRFSGVASTSFAIETGKAAHGKAALNLTFTTEQYSGIELLYFNGDWQGFNSLVMEIRNDEDNVLTIGCRIHDVHHNRDYHDRFNRGILLAPGWNTVVIPLKDVRSAPRGREMDMAHITGLELFSVKLPRPRSIALDYIRLEKN